MTGAGCPTWEALAVRQFGYASVPRLPGRAGGGWGVFAGAADERDLAWVSLRIVSSVQIQEYYEPGELSRRPVRLRAGRGEPDPAQPGQPRTIIAHSVDAGPDPTSRPGNVISHVVVSDRPTPRPIELWGSPDWVVPYGVRALEQTDLPASVRPGPLTRAESLQWASTQVALGWVLDVVEQARANGDVVVLRTHTPQEAARWIAAVSHLTARTLAPSFSTFEDALSVGPAVALGLSLIGVDADFDAAVMAAIEGATLIDPSWNPSLPQQLAGGGGWQLPHGQEVPVGLWHNVVLDLLAAGSQAADVLTRCDEIGAQIAPEAPYYWPLAVAMLESGIEILEREAVLAQVLRDVPATAPDAIVNQLRDEAGVPRTTAADLGSALSGPGTEAGVESARSHGGITPAEAALLTTIDSRREPHQRRGLAEAVLRLHGILADGFHHEHVSDDLALFAGHYLAAAVEPTAPWMTNACRVWRQLTTLGEAASPAGRRLLGEIAQVALRDDGLAAVLPSDVTAVLAGRFDRGTPGGTR